jgi:hypothetical protein
MDAPSGSPKVQFLGHRNEVSQMPELHAAIIADNYQYRIFNILEYRQSLEEDLATAVTGFRLAFGGMLGRRKETHANAHVPLV